ncbi:hypothetical protein B0H10DRAFT_1949415 [Mycena sp. CBHHK59/15]|nr:hypothetical protein B0H10DRAFT_1949415 [Mycena sp. CBHHK59/15]
MYGGNTPAHHAIGVAYILSNDNGHVVLDALGLHVDAPTHTYNTRRSTTKSSGGLVAAEAAEDIWAFNNEGRLWEDVRAPVEKSDSEGEEDSGDNYDAASDEEE